MLIQGLIVLAFESQPAEKALLLFAELISLSRSRIVWPSLEAGPYVGKPDVDQDKTMEWSANIQIPEAELPGLGIIPKVGLTMMKVKGGFDIELDVANYHVPDEDQFVKGLFDYAQYLAERLDLTNYFCGFDSAQDEDTRYFTGSAPGPYFPKD